MNEKLIDGRIIQYDVLADKICGVYLIIAPYQKIYVGSSVDIKTRWQQHIKALRGNKHHAYKLQKMWNTYTKGTFVFMLAEQTYNLLRVEQQCIDNIAAKNLLNTYPYADPTIINQIRHDRMSERVLAHYQEQQRLKRLKGE